MLSVGEGDGEEAEMQTSGYRGRGRPSIRQRVAKMKVPRPCERAEWATKTCWESREGFSSGGRGEWAGKEMHITLYIYMNVPLCIYIYCHINPKLFVRASVRNP